MSPQNIRRRIVRAPLALALASVLAQTAYAAPDPLPESEEPVAAAGATVLDSVVVTASGFEQVVREAPASISIITREDLETKPWHGLAEALADIEGVDVGNAVDKTGAPSIAIRGMPADYTLILIDGRRQNAAGNVTPNNFGGTANNFIPPLSAIERIEVIRGPMSTLYGSDAMGGVVNIITRRPADDGQLLGGSVSGTVGAQGRLDGAGRVQLALGHFSGSVDVARRSQETAPGVSRNDGAMAERFDVSSSVMWRPDSAKQVELGVLALDERQRWRSGNFYDISDNLQYNARIGGSIARGVHRLSPKVAISDWDHVIYTSAYTAPVAGDPGERQRQRVLLGELLYNGSFKRFSLDGGVQLRNDAIETDRVAGGRREHNSLEPFAQVEFSPLRSVTLLPGVRVTHSDVWGTHVTPRVSARAQVAPRLTLRASYGDGFRAPDFKELFLVFQNTNAGYAVQGNPNLKPEHSHNTMLGLEWATAGGYVRGQLFHNSFEDFIETEVISPPNAPLVFEYKNRERGWTRGAELESGANLVASGRLRGEIGVSFLETRDEGTDLELLGRPHFSGRVGMQAVLPFELRSSVTLVHTGRTPMQRDDATGVVAEYRDAFTRVDLRFARGIGRSGLEFSIGADNVFDSRPRRWAGFTGRHVYTTITYALPGYR